MKVIALSLLAFAALLAPGCLSPTLPLPPPDAPNVIRESAPGEWLVAGDCTPGAIVTVLNLDTAEGIVFWDKLNTGLYAVTVKGAECDVAQLEENVGGEASSTTDFALHRLDPAHPIDNPGCN
ncbi:MAG TPA: hypothetical protein VGM56_15395 [Byssovorax sp.]|jgi:hypothetical protein